MKKTIRAQTTPNKPEKAKPRRLAKWHKSTITTTAREYRTIKKFVDKCLVNLPGNIQGKLIAEYCKRFASQTAENPQRAANIYLRKSTKPMQRVIRLLPFDDKSALKRDEVLEKEAMFAQAYCRQEMLKLSDAEENYETKLKLLHDRCFAFAKRFDLPPMFNIEKPETALLESAIVRYDCDKWWLRKLTRVRNQAVEYMHICGGFVGKGRQEYASDKCVNEWRSQQRENMAYLEAMEVVNEQTEERFSLSDIAMATTANPEHRRTELMVRCRGLESLAEDLGYMAFFVTWTAPSKYHANSRKWNNAKPTKTQSYLCSQWAKCRAKIKREEIEWFGVRVAEPHTDSTPHWHMLIFCKPEQSNRMINIMTKYALEHDADEKGADKHRFTIEEIDTSKGSATGYIAKYISKNINAAKVGNEPDFDGSGSLSDAADRVRAWASRWNIRQFQFFGAAPVTVYREARRIAADTGCEIINAVAKAADSGKWDAFTRALLKNPVKLKREVTTNNRYGEPVKTITGLFSAAKDFLTREVSFRLEKRRAQRVESGGSRAPWSTVNNCTQLLDRVLQAIKIPQIEPILAPALAAGARVYDRGRGFQIINNELREIQP